MRTADEVLTGRLLYRCDLAELGESVFDLDMFRHGANADRDGGGLMLRQLHQVEDPDSYDLLSQPEADHYDVTADGLRLRLRPHDTVAGRYSTTEWAAGPAEHFDQAGLARAGAAGDGRCLMVGRALTFRVRFSPNYGEGTALGTAGVIAQDWRGFEDRSHRPKFRDYLALAFSYIGPQAGAMSAVLSRSRHPRLAALAFDYTTNTMWAHPVPRSLDIGGWHHYTIEWHPAEVRYLVDGHQVAAFRQGQRALNLGLVKGRPGSPVRRGFLLPVTLQPDAWLDNNNARRPRMDDTCAYVDEQWIDVSRVEMAQL